jgi:hypothetical protein
MTGNIATDKMESVREMMRIYNNFMSKRSHNNKEYRNFVNSFFVTPERKNIMSLMLNKAMVYDRPIDSHRSFRLLFNMWADKELTLFATQLISEEAKIGMRLGV